MTTDRSRRPTPATEYSRTAQEGDRGVALVRQVVAAAGSVYRPFDAADLGIDGAIELIDECREPTGELVLVQVKSGCSYVRRGRYRLASDARHFETWSRYSVPVVGIVHDPSVGRARWVDISEHLRRNPQVVTHGPFYIDAPADQPFSAAGFPAFSRRFRRPGWSQTSVDVAPNLRVRAWRPDDAPATRALLRPVAIDYPGFDAWLERQWQNPQVSKKVVEVGRAVAAYSMWRKKDARHVKLQTFFVGPLFRGTAIGQHLLYHELRTWGRDPSIRKIWLTVAASKVDLIRYLCHFGFRVEGFAANRYARRGSATEVVLARHLVRRAVRSVDDLRRLVAHLRTVTWGMDKSSADGNRFGVPSAAMAVPASFPGVRVKIEHPLPPTGAARLVLHDTAGHIMMSWDDVGLMREFYPLRMHLPDRRYVAVPIYRKWVNAFFGERDQPAAGTAVRRLRVDHVYYCYPKIPDLAPGDLIVFYEPRLGGGRGAAIGAAVVREVRIQPPDALYRRFRGLGVYRKADVQRHAKAGKAMAIHFDLYESFIRPVPLERIRAVMGTSTRMQGLTPLGREAFERIRAEGLAES